MKTLTAKYQPKEGDLSVWHIPQVPMKPFRVLVDNPAQGLMLMDVLGDYDLFQLENNIKPDYSNVNGLDVFEGGEWVTWYDDEGNDIDDMIITDDGRFVSQWELD